MQHGGTNQMQGLRMLQIGLSRLVIHALPRIAQHLDLLR